MTRARAIANDLRDLGQTLDTIRDDLPGIADISRRAVQLVRRTVSRAADELLSLDKSLRSARKHVRKLRGARGA